MKINLILILLFLSIVNVHGQMPDDSKTDSIKSIHFLKKTIVPISLIGVGILFNNSDFERQLQTDLRNKVGNDYKFRIDDYLLYVPVAEMYIADAFGVKAKNHWFDQTKYLLISNIVSYTITGNLKTIIKKTRPDGLPYSFPSGHTNIAFTNATVLYNEFKDSAPVLAYSGFAFATTTGVFRMINNKHFLSDVLAGAGIGILVTELVYHFEPFKNFNPFKNSKNVSFYPQINVENYGFYFVYKF
ncbi:MAG: phosphatase PAP2 family protein [Lutibacter sp.]